MHPALHSCMHKTHTLVCTRMHKRTHSRILTCKKRKHTHMRYTYMHKNTHHYYVYLHAETPTSYVLTCTNTHIHAFFHAETRTPMCTYMWGIKNGNMGESQFTREGRTGASCAHTTTVTLEKKKPHLARLITRGHHFCTLFLFNYLFSILSMIS